MASLLGKRQREEEEEDEDDANGFSIVLTAKCHKLEATAFGAPELCDMTLSVTMPNGEVNNFSCCAALIAISSRVLRALIYGPMAEVGLLDKPRDERIVHITGDDNHVHFGLLLQYMHHDIAFSADLATDIYMIADYYEVRGLCDACAKFWSDTLSTSNCCAMLNLATSVNCIPLLQRCHDVLVLGFGLVVQNDPDFGDLDATILKHITSLDSLVCGSEFNVVLALFKWFSGGKVFSLAKAKKKEAVLIDILKGAVRWDRVLSASIEFLLTELADDVSEKDPMHHGACLPLVNIVRACVDNVPTVSHTERSLQHPSPFRLNTNPRQYAWGRLRAHNPPLPFPQPYQDVGMDMYLSGTDDYIVGRSRKSSPGFRFNIVTVSSKHFVVSGKIVWPGDKKYDPLLGIGCSEDIESSTARLVPYITDTSMNGVYVDDKRIPSGTPVPMKPLSRIRMVVPSEHATAVAGQAAAAAGAIPIPPWFTNMSPQFHGVELDDRAAILADAKNEDDIHVAATALTAAALAQLPG